MAKSRIVGSRELKTRLGHYLGRVRRGETILVTDRHEPVAELRPLPDERGEKMAALHRLAAMGSLTLPSRRALSRFTPIRASRARSGSDAVSADRDERG